MTGLVFQFISESVANFNPKSKTMKITPFHLAAQRGHFNICKLIQQGLEIHGLKECGPWGYTVFNWFSKHLRYTDFGQKP